MENESNNENEALAEYSEFDANLNPNEESYSYENDGMGIADGFVSFIAQSVADELVETIVGNLINLKSASIKQESAAEGITIDPLDISHSASEDKMEQVEDELEVSESDKSLTCHTDYLNEFVTKEIVDQLDEFLTESVIDYVIEAAVKRVSALVVGRKVEELTEFITVDITNRKILRAVVKITGVLMTHHPDCEGNEIAFPFEYLPRDYLQKPIEDIRKKLTDQITEGIADIVIVDILGSLTEETTNHLTDYVFEYILEDFMEEVSEELGESNTNCSSRTYRTPSDLSEDIDYKSECDSDANVQKDEKEVKDNEQGLDDTTVPLRSFFSFVNVEKDPCYVVNVPNRPTLETLMMEMVTKNLGSTFRVKVGDRIFECIPRLLKVNSSMFANLDWRVDYIVFSSSDVSASAFELIYEWMRFQKPIELHNVIKVMQGARYLKVDLLEMDCWEIISREHVREKLALRLSVEAEKMPMMDDVFDILLGRVRNYFLALVGSEEFMSLKVDLLTSLLSRDTIGVNSEAEVFFAALRWLSKSRQRLEHIKAVMKCVRFQYVPLPMLFIIRIMGKPNEGDKNKPIDSSERVMQEFHKFTELTNMLYDAVTYISMQFQNALDGDPMDPCISKKRVNPRRWVYHPKCPYHKSKLLYPYQQNFTQANFDNYVASIQKDWLGDEPPKNAVFEVEFDGAVHNSNEKDDISSS